MIPVKDTAGKFTHRIQKGEKLYATPDSTHPISEYSDTYTGLYSYLAADIEVTLYKKGQVWVPVKDAPGRNINNNKIHYVKLYGDGSGRPYNATNEHLATDAKMISGVWNLKVDA